LPRKLPSAILRPGLMRSARQLCLNGSRPTGRGPRFPAHTAVSVFVSKGEAPIAFPVIFDN